MVAIGAVAVTLDASVRPTSAGSPALIRPAEMRLNSGRRVAPVTSCHIERLNRRIQTAAYSREC
eukprot:7379886-Prymnesium_polylepis.2